MNDHLDGNPSAPAQAQLGSPDGVVSPMNGTTIAQPDFKQIEEILKGRQVGSDILLNIPIWGWTGDGKTCCLLTAIHFSEPAQHPFGFALVDDTDELAELEAANEDYKFLNLVSAAESTTQRFRRLSELFIDQNEFPPGTDELSSYILAIRDISSTAGYAIFPDLRGGSYREQDGPAREVLKRAHAMVVLVNPELFNSQGTEGKQYKDGILFQLQRCNKAKVPVCVMITKSDLHKGQHHATDATESDLTIILKRQTGLIHHLARVSVIGLERELGEGNKLPPVQDRHPIELIHAWNWVIAQAVCRPEDEIRSLGPAVNIQAASEGSNRTRLPAQSEMRSVGEFSEAPGLLLCASEDTTVDRAFTFLSSSGEMFETKIGTTASEIPAFRAIGNLTGWTPELESKVCGYYIGGEYYIGPDHAHKVNSIWFGAKGGNPQQISLPFEAESWTPIGARRLLVLDARGRIHLLKFEGTKMVQADYIENFVPETGTLVCVFEEKNSRVTALNGSEAESVLLGPNDHFGDRVQTDMRNTFDGVSVITNRLGVSLAISKSGQITLSGPSKPIDLGTHPSATLGGIALAANASMAGIVTEDLRLMAHASIGGSTKSSELKLSPVLHERPTSMGWSKGGDLLVATFSDKTWRVFRPFGLQ